MAASTSSTSPPPPPPLRGTEERRPGTGRLVAILFLAFVVLCAGVYAWKALAVRRVEAKLHARTGTMLRLAAVPLAWLVRAEVMDGNLGEIEGYFRRFVTEPGVQRLVFVDAKGVIAVSTDANLEGGEAADLLRDVALDANEVVVEEVRDRHRVVVPIMGLDSRLGTLIVDYGMGVPR